MSTLNPNESAGYLANQMARLFAVQLAEALTPLNLATAQFAVLMHLWQQDQRTQSELAACIGLEQATMANTLARMERDGLIERHPHPADRRAQMIHLTQRAKDLQEPATSTANNVNAQTLSPLSEQEQQQLVSLMTRVIQHQLAWRAGR